jgi:hypothetical protein
MRAAKFKNTKRVKKALIRAGKRATMHHKKMVGDEGFEPPTLCV